MLLRLLQDNYTTTTGEDGLKSQTESYFNKNIEGYDTREHSRSGAGFETYYIKII